MFALVPYRWNLFDDERIDLAARRTGERSFSLDVPADLATGWYLLLTTVNDNDGNPVSVKRALTEDMGKYLDRQIVVIRGDDEDRFMQVHTEFNRAVYSPGEAFRLYVSARGRQGHHQPGDCWLISTRP